MRNLKKIDNSEDYQIKLDENFNCPFLTEENLCGIQKKYGEDFLSETCATYPRRTWNFEDFYERSLSLTCPVVAEMVLLENAQTISRNSFSDGASCSCRNGFT